MNRKFGQPMLPRGILHDMEELRAAPADYDPKNGGQWIGGVVERVKFKGCVLPVSEADWKTAPQGTFTQDSRKVYTNGHALRIGGEVYDPDDGQTYKVTGDLNHGSISPIRRFVVERKGVAAQ